MSYQVLARKWRPKSFAQLMGQEHVVTVLVNAIAQQRLHHAYLFTGTRGVGKTTIARIFAKSLNCQEGISAEPCGKCDVCLDIDEGRFVDLLEIDAASRTKVDDTREILDNVQYAPTRGRYKVYLIDEVHMLSRSSFNALLKTLEEPPEHVKFILATTDPQKLPITVLSRCLQFHLKALTVSQIEQKLTEILDAEKISVEGGALNLLAKAAKGSMRDSLSLTDQAIAQGQGHIALANIQQMLGGIDQNWPFKILIALLKQDAKGLMALSQEMASYAPNYSRLYAELIQLLHQVALYQMVEQHLDMPIEHVELLKKFSKAMSPEDVQLYYQLALNGRKDLSYAGDEQAAFDMTLLRLLAFKPATEGTRSNVNTTQLNDTAEPNDTEVSFDDVELTDTLISQSNSNSNHVAVHEKAEPVKPSQSDIHQQADKGSELQEQEQEQELLAAEQKLAQEMLSIEQTAQDQFVAQNPVDKGANESENHAQNNDSQPLDSLQLEQASQEITEPKIDNSLEQDNSPEPNNSLEQDSALTLSNDLELATDTLPATSTLTEPSNTAVASEQLKQAEQPENNSGQPPTGVEHGQGQTLVQTPQSTAESEAISALDSPVEKALATRNMLRSRKKKLESAEKKSDDAITRQKEEAALAAKKAQIADVPSIETLPDEPFSAEVIDPSVVKKANQVDRWANMIDNMALNGRLRQLALRATIDEASNDDQLILLLNQSTKHLKTEVAHQQLEQFVSEYFNKPMLVDIQIVEETVDDPFQIQGQINDKRYDYAKEVLLNDDIVQALQSEFYAQLDENTIVAR